MSAHVDAVGPYRLVDRIGVGGMAVVYRAVRHGASGFGKAFALKMLRLELEHDAELQRLLVAEAKLGAAMAHRNVVGVFDLGIDEGRYYVAMELVDGADLHGVHRGAAMPEALAVYVVEEVASALAYLHAFAVDGRPLGLVHRDINPGNVLVSRTGEVKLADLGIVKATSLAEQTRARIVRGKVAYLAPEQLAGEPLGGYTDQFALGIMLCELVTGRRPFDGATAVETMDRIRGAETDLSGVPEHLVPVVARCLRPAPSDRFPDVTAFVAALRKVARTATPPELAAWVATRVA